MPVRRAADPISVQHVWDAIRSANAQRQMADLQRIIKYLQRVDNCSQAQAELYVKQTLDDGFIVALNKVTAKGSKVGAQVESYKIPVQELPAPENDGKDWYCIDCHLAGDVIACRTCHRVYHVECANKKQHMFKKTTCSLPDLSSPAKRLSYLSSESNSPLPRETNINDNETAKPPDNDNELEKDKTFDITSEHESTTNTSVDCTLDNVERELEKMEESCITIINSSSSSVSQISENHTDITKGAGKEEVDKESGISSSKSDQIAILLSDEDNSIIYDETLCSICNMCRIEPDVTLEKEELNYLLAFVHGRIKSWLPASITDTMSQEPKAEWLNEAEVTWRAKQLFYQPMNMVIIEMKLQTMEYTQLTQFKSDVMMVQHNVAVYHGIESQEFGAAEYMLEDCRYDLSELLNCPDCYKHSNEKVNTKWFCLPCRIPHKLVWAKQKGYPYWPAKVLKETDDACDVRFFGGKYERSFLPKMYIKPISVNMNNLQVKKSAAFNKSVEELMVHQKMLDNPTEAQQYINLTRKRKLSSSKVKSSPVNKLPKVVVIKKRKKSMDLPKDVYEFQDSPANVEANLAGNPPKVATGIKRKRSTSPSSKAKPVRTSEYPTRRAIQDQINKNKVTVTVKNGANQNATNDIINVSPDFGDGDEFAIRDEDYEFGRGCDESHEEVSSSTEQIRPGEEGYVRDNCDGLMPETERQYSESVEKTRRKLEQCRDKKQLIKVALECMQAEIDRINNEHDDYLKKVFEAHNTQISETKKKQWCYNCEQDAIYHCCWNTAYCSPTCQQHHWQAEHKKVCRRKR